MAVVGSDDAKYKCRLSLSLLEKAEIELNEKEKWRDRDIQALRDMVILHKGLRCRTDCAFLLRFLRARKFDYDRAYSLLVNYYTIRAANADILKELTPRALEHVFKTGIVSVLPHRDSQGRQILYFRPGKWNPNDFPIFDILRTNILNLELAVMSEETQISGLVLIGNMTDVGLAQAKNFERSYAKIMTSLIQDAFPLRFKGLHFINEPTIFGAIFTIVKPFLKEKTVKRFTFHGSSLESLHKCFDPNILPEELGGTLPSGDILAQDWRVKALEHQPMFEDAQNKYGIELTRNLSASKADDAVECLVGTYKKLNVD